MAIINYLPQGNNKKAEDMVFQFQELEGVTYSDGKIISLNWSNLSSSTFTSSLKSNIQYIKLNYCTTIGPSAFRHVINLKTVIFPACTYLGESTFYSVRNLEKAHFAVCSELSGTVFGFCVKLSDIFFPQCVTLRGSPFYNCTSLTKVSLPICQSVAGFSQCKLLSEIWLPKCNYLAQVAFDGCSSLMSIYVLNNSICQLYNINAFRSTPLSNSSYTGSFGSIFVPSSLVNTYKTSTNWTTYSARITAYTG